ncbi:hypothetical protein F53441_12749 [Fusarium austroafricanum]|uniref:Uncharacterized protein n=1 Tax=Fusarium austroafricanum TaxID=2364996 RepID=A0A8H4NNQ1_9HYPO|nr:hypothetical protein F53441_12749 [Fusarium austroafricanum]
MDTDYVSQKMVGIMASGEGFNYPKEPVLEFIALPVGHFKCDLPFEGSEQSSNRKKKSKAFLMVKRDDNKTGFLWCDADGKAVNKKFIKKAKGFDLLNVKKDLVKAYNDHVKAHTGKYHNDVLAVHMLRAIAQLGRVTGTDGFDSIGAPGDIGNMVKEPVLCSVSDPELTRHL